MDGKILARFAEQFPALAERMDALGAMTLVRMTLDACEGVCVSYDSPGIRPEGV